MLPVVDNNVFHYAIDKSDGFAHSTNYDVLSQKHRHEFDPIVEYIL